MAAGAGRKAAPGGLRVRSPRACSHFHLFVRFRGQPHDVPGDFPAFFPCAFEIRKIPIFRLVVRNIVNCPGGKGEVHSQPLGQQDGIHDEFSAGFKLLGPAVGVKINVDPDVDGRCSQIIDMDVEPVLPGQRVFADKLAQAFHKCLDKPRRRIVLDAEGGVVAPVDALAPVCPAAG